MLTAWLLPVLARAGAFETHTGWQHEPRLETARAVSLGKSVLEMSVGSRFLISDSFFNSDGDIAPAPYRYFVSVLDFHGAFGFTDNWTMWLDLPLVWSEQTDNGANRRADGELGDAEAGLLYQFYRSADPLVSLGLGVRWKLPTGNEAPGNRTVNITGTGTTDIELFFTGRWQVWRYLALGGGLGYNVRLPGAVQFLSDRHSSITNAFLDLGDELFFRLQATAALEWLALRLTGEFRWRFPTKVGMAEYRAEQVDWSVPKNGGSSDGDEFILFNGVRYQEWRLHQRLDPSGELVSNQGFLVTLTPRIIIKPLDWLDIDLFARFHLLGRNSIYLTDKDGDNPSFNNFMPMQVLGTSLGDSVVLGEMGLTVTTRW
ncbi:MAG: hypothetical protein DRI34_04685 [Deltaproteobacteria bacterium]|nr:MAG: hypothetical protein DRI34_04685 [Deltaproteobacteria bacterium]